ncbi:MAG: Clp protease ClpP [Comamonas sp.]|uniref:head maturation protease, ClpP-related n=1 Tax=Comamonas sp. TaxID=34028 RepID=UPI002FC63BD9
MDFYSFVRNEAENTDELHIDGEIAAYESWFIDVIAPRAFRRALARTRDVTVYINSPGGDVFAAAEIYTALREHKGKIVVKVTGIAASAASLIAMAGDEIYMSPVAYMMIHDPWTYVQGNAREMEHQALVLREIGEGLITAYQTRTGKSRDEIAELLAAETYMNAQTCVDEGFADGILYENEQEAAKKEKQPSTLMKASRHGQAAVFALMQGDNGSHDRKPPPIQPDPCHDRKPPPIQPDPCHVAQRAEIAKRAMLLEALFSHPTQTPNKKEDIQK